MPTIEQLETLLEREPDDVFLNFGLAMALASAGRIDEAAGRFDRVLSLDSRYVPAYFQKARMLAERGDPDAARTELERGITVARETGDEHALREMSEYLEMLG